MHYIYLYIIYSNFLLNIYIYYELKYEPQSIVLTVAYESHWIIDSASVDPLPKKSQGRRGPRKLEGHGATAASVESHLWNMCLKRLKDADSNAKLDHTSFFPVGQGCSKFHKANGQRVRKNRPGSEMNSCVCRKTIADRVFMFFNFLLDSWKAIG
jgi:hypothetical protein